VVTIFGLRLSGVVLAPRFCATFDPPDVPLFVRWLIFPSPHSERFASPSLHWERTGIIRGKKTSAFSSALAGHQTAVVLDVHMANIFNVPQQKLFRQDVYASILGKLCKLSERNGLSLRDVQAALWCGWKLRQNQTVEPFPILDEYALWQRLNRQYPDVGPIA
jgi:hypothetical protein